MNLILLGSSEFVVPVFDALRQEHKILEVYTREPKPSGRKALLTNTPVYDWAKRNKLPIRTDIQEFTGIGADFAIVMSYGVIIPDDILAKCRFLNIHPSDLPKYRGPSPIRTAIRNGDTHSAVCLTKMVHKIDAGDVYLREGFDIDIDDTNEMVQHKVSDITIGLLHRFLLNPEKYPAIPQVGEPVMTKLTKTEDRIINWSMSPVDIHNRIRAYGSVLAMFGDLQVKILKTRLEGDMLRIIVIQPCGKKPMCWNVFRNGHDLPKELVNIIKID